MPWLAGLGAIVLGAGAAYGATMVVGGIIVGAAIGGLYAAVTGGNILKGVLYGALGGATVGVGGALLYGGTALSAGGGISAGGEIVTTSAGAGLAAGEAGILQAGSLAGAGELAAGAGTATTTGVTAGTGATKGAASLFTADGLQGIAAVGSMGSAFLQGGDQLDADATLTENEKDRQLARDLHQDSTSLEETRLNIASNEKTAKNNLLENARQFDETIDFDKLKFDTDLEEEANARDRQRKGIFEASKYVKGNTSTVSLVESNSQRRNIPAPIWSEAVAPEPQGVPA